MIRATDAKEVGVGEPRWRNVLPPESKFQKTKRTLRYRSPCCLVRSRSFFLPFTS